MHEAVPRALHMLWQQHGGHRQGHEHQGEPRARRAGLRARWLPRSLPCPPNITMGASWRGAAFAAGCRTRGGGLGRPGLRPIRGRGSRRAGASHGGRRRPGPRGPHLGRGAMMTLRKPFTPFNLSLSKSTTSLRRPAWRGIRSTRAFASCPGSTGQSLQGEKGRQDQPAAPLWHLPQLPAWGQGPCTLLRCTPACVLAPRLGGSQELLPSLPPSRCLQGVLRLGTPTAAARAPTAPGSSGPR